MTNATISNAKISNATMTNATILNATNTPIKMVEQCSMFNVQCSMFNEHVQWTMFNVQWTFMSQNAKKLLQVTLTFATKMSKTASPCQKCLCPAPSGTRNSQMSDKEDWISNRVNQYFRGKKVWIIINNENSEKRGLHRAISS